MKRFHVSKNLFDTSNAVADKYISSEGHVTTGVYPEYNFSYVMLNVTPNTTYRFKYEYTISTITPTTYSNTHRRIIAYDVNGNYLSQIIDIQPTEDYYGGGTFTTPENCYKISINYINDEKSNYDYNIMLNEGDEDLPYEPYGNTWQTKNPPRYGTAADIITDLPQEIITDGQPIGANLFDISTATMGYYINTNGEEAESTSTGTWAKLNHTDYIPISGDTTYTYHYTNSNPYNSATQTIAMCWFDRNKSLISRTTMQLSSEIYEHTMYGQSPTDAKYLIINFTFYNNTAVYMLNIGSTPIPYQPYAPTIIKGNMVQSGTPTPASPITPSECGDTTANLFDVESFVDGISMTRGTYQYEEATNRISITATSNDAHTGNSNSYHIPVQPLTSYSISFATNSISGYIYIFENGITSGDYAHNSSNDSLTFTTQSDTTYIIVRLGCTNANTTKRYRDIMLIEGTTPLSFYEPYGYKIPISSSGKNLFDKDSAQYSTVGYMKDDGTFSENNNYGVSGYIQLSPNTQYTVSDMNVNGLYPAICFYTDNKTFISGIKYNGLTMLSFTTPINCKYALISYLKSNINNTMLNKGSTPLPYEPYNRTTTPVYLGEVQTTRRIKKYEFTGQESDLRIQDIITTTNAVQLPTTLSDYKREPFICSHMTVSNSSGGTSTHGFYGQLLTLCFDKSMGLDTLEKIRTYLAQQYAAGTPVTVWYILAEPTATTLNEPMRKIGDYSDTVSVANIPTIAGKQTFDVDITLKPSEVDLTYHGWHEHQPKKCVGGVVNKFDYLTMADGVTGYYLDNMGEQNLSGVWSITDYIPCNGTTFTINHIGGTIPAICLYDENKQYITGKSYDTKNATVKTSVTITSAQVAKYIRFSYYTQETEGYDDLSTIMLVEGSTVPDHYIPYIDWIDG